VRVDHPNGDLADRARRALAALSPTHREVVVEVALRRRTVAEAAEVLGIPVDAAMARLTCALHAFRERLIEAA